MKKREFNSDFALFSDTKEIVSRLKEFINENYTICDLYVIEDAITNLEGMHRLLRIVKKEGLELK